MPHDSNTATSAAATDEAPLFETIWHMTWPTVIYSILQSLVGMADVFMVGRLGPRAISAVGFSQQIMMIVIVGVLAVSTGTMALVSQSYGAGDHARLRNVVRQSMILAVGAAIVIGGVGVALSEPMLRLLGARPLVLVQALPYNQLMFAGIIFMLPNFIIASVFRGTGDMITPLKIATGTNVINVIGDYCFIFGPGPFPALGVAGAAVGTLIARAVSAYWGLVLLRGGRARTELRWDEEPRVDPHMMRQILHIGIPSAAQGLFRNGARIIYFKFIADSAAATLAVAAVTIGFQLRGLVVMPAIAFSTAATALVGHALGAGNMKRAGQLAHGTIRLCCFVMFALCVAQWVFARQLMAIFTHSVPVIEMGVTMMHYFAIAQFFSAWSIVLGGVLTGGGDTAPPMVYTVISQWLLLLPITYILMHHEHIGLLGAWVAWAVAPVVQTALMVVRYVGGKWKRALV